MRQLTLVTNLSAAPSVTTNAQDHLYWRYMKEFTLVINHTVVVSVIRNSITCPTWRNMKKITPLQHLHHFLRKSRKNHYNKIKLYNINFQVKINWNRLKLHLCQYSPLVYFQWSSAILYFIIVREGKISGTTAARGLKFWLQVALLAPISTA